tara:strand:+ start:67 stop:270 length:204 start_codon:yes stop_codon:yes gene_type:complete
MEKQEYAPALPKNSINTPLQPSLDELKEELQEYKKDNARLRKNNETYKLQYIEIREKLYKILELAKL